MVWDQDGHEPARLDPIAHIFDTSQGRSCCVIAVVFEIFVPSVCPTVEGLCVCVTQAENRGPGRRASLSSLLLSGGMVCALRRVFRSRKTALFAGLSSSVPDTATATSIHAESDSHRPLKPWETAFCLLHRLMKGVWRGGTPDMPLVSGRASRLR